jgi:ATP-binding cassette subfamily B protein
MLNGDQTSSLVDDSMSNPATMSKRSQPVGRSKICRDGADLLKVVDLGVHYRGENSGIKRVSFNVPKNSFTVVTGRVGSGKTTLLKTLLGLLPAESGKISWKGQEIDHPESFLVYPRVGYVPQSPILMSESIRNNILLGLKEDEVNVRTAIYDSVLERDLAGFPNGLDTQVGIKGMTLSGGQIQRTAAARAFVRRPELFVIDDLSTALDVETEKTLWHRAKAMKHGTFLISSHRQSILRLADQILLLEKGELKSCGTLDELLKTSEEMRLLWGNKR